ncbi:hypothetical protein [Kribbella sp. VKM Ac-2571]|uniref:hypothetical protein n=1 Tax=Kribbella sp. VKM Ac-2571 TaxID=2512222 RepID=UPI0035119544
MIDRLVHHADVIAPKGDSHRLKTTTSAGSPPRPTTNHDNQQGVHFQPPQRGPFSTVVDNTVHPARRPTASRTLRWATDALGRSSNPRSLRQRRMTGSVRATRVVTHRRVPFPDGESSKPVSRLIQHGSSNRMNSSMVVPFRVDDR